MPTPREYPHSSSDLAIFALWFGVAKDKLRHDYGMVLTTLEEDGALALCYLNGDTTEQAAEIMATAKLAAIAF